MSHPPIISIRVLKRSDNENLLTQKHICNGNTRLIDTKTFNSEMQRCARLMCDAFKFQWQHSTAYNSVAYK